MLKDNPTFKEVLKELMDRIKAENAYTKEAQDFICYTVIMEAVEKGLNVKDGLIKLKHLTDKLEEAAGKDIPFGEIFANDKGEDK